MGEGGEGERGEQSRGGEGVEGGARGGEGTLERHLSHNIKEDEDWGGEKDGLWCWRN